MPGELIDALRRCPSLRHIAYETTGRAYWDKRADQLMEVQCAVPRVRWHLGPAPYDCFDESRQFCSHDYRDTDSDDDN